MWFFRTYISTVLSVASASATQKSLVISCFSPEPLPLLVDTLHWYGATGLLEFRLHVELNISNLTSPLHFRHQTRPSVMVGVVRGCLVKRISSISQNERALWRVSCSTFTLEALSLGRKLSTGLSLGLSCSLTERSTGIVKAALMIMIFRSNLARTQNWPFANKSSSLVVLEANVLGK